MRALQALRMKRREQRRSVGTVRFSENDAEGSGKLALEFMLKDLAAAHGLNYFLLRYFNAAGADPDGEIGEKHIPETHLIPLLLNSIFAPIISRRRFIVNVSHKAGTFLRQYSPGEIIVAAIIGKTVFGVRCCWDTKMLALSNRSEKELQPTI